MKTEHVSKVPSRAIAALTAVVITLLGALMLLGVPTLSMQAQAVEPPLVAASVSDAFNAQADDFDLSWYEGKTSPYTISNVKELKGFAYLVNTGTHDFAGETVQLPLTSTSAIIFSQSASIDPIGTETHPFQGTFNGNGRTIWNLSVNVPDTLSYIGLFGYAGEAATIENLNLLSGAITVSNTTDGKTITHVGAIAGHLGGSIKNCSSSAAVSITNNGAVPNIEGTTPEELSTITYIGGLVGSLNGDMANCTHTATLSISSTSDISEGVPYIAVFVGGIAGFQGIESDAAHVTAATDCKNSGALAFNVTGKGGVDRFQQQMYSKSAMVGGIAGYTMGNVYACENSAEIQTSFLKNGSSAVGWGASTTGGIVGSLRGPTIVESTSATGVVGTSTGDPGYDVWKNSNGAKKPQTITVEKCNNTGHIIGLTSVGGMCGSTGAFTEVSGCANSGKIDGTRWNKPCPAGIVGISNGNISYCSNNGRVETLDGGGFYASGICALLTTYNESSTPADIVMEGPELYGCYVSQPIVSAKAGYKAAVLAGENEGYIHDNCFLPNLTLDKVVDRDTFGDDEPHSALVVTGENRGTISNNYELSDMELRGSKGISLLNRVSATNEGWKYYYVPDTAHGGYPLLNWQSGGYSDAKTQLSSIVKSTVLDENPRYSSTTTPTPSITLETVDGRILYQNSDYRVVPQTGATAVSSGQPYLATIEGINGYAGTISSIAYGIDKCDISTCTVLAGSQVFNWEDQKPAWVKVVDKAGIEVPASDYEWDRVDFDPTNVKSDKGKYHDYTNAHSDTYKYDIKVTAKSSSKNYQGSTTQAAFRIERALLVYESPDAVSTKHGSDYDKVVWNGQEWDYEEAINTRGFVKIEYTGKPIEPTVANPTYLGHALRDGTGKEYWNDPLSYDFRYIYGNANAESASSTGTDCVNVTGSDEKSLACMTVRYTAGGNFTNYSNVYFEITPANIDGLKVSGLNKALPYTGKQVKAQPTLTYNGVKLNNSDFTFTYKNNVNIGTALMTITGKNFTGSKTVKFKIGKGIQPMKVKVSKKTVKKATLASESVEVSPIKVSNAVGKVSYKNVSKKAALKKFKVSSSGAITIPKGTKAGTYKIDVKVSAGGDKRYASGSKTVTATIRVK